MSNAFRVPCPVCGNSMANNGSVQQNPFLKVMNYQCRQVGCGGTYKYHLELFRTITPSSCLPQHNISHDGLVFNNMNPTPPLVTKRHCPPHPASKQPEAAV